MALGRRKPRQSDLFIPTAHLATGPGHPLYTKLNQVLADAGFDTFVEQKCAPYYREGGRPGIPPGVYFRMLLIGYLEGLDSLALRAFLGVPLTEDTPVHVSMTMIRKRLPESVYDAVFGWVLEGLVRGETVGIDATTLEANAAMRSIVRKDTGQDWREYLQGLALAEGIENPTDEQLRRLDRRRKGKKVSNRDWESSTDADSRISPLPRPAAARALPERPL